MYVVSLNLFSRVSDDDFPFTLVSVLHEETTS